MIGNAPAQNAFHAFVKKRLNALLAVLAFVCVASGAYLLLHTDAHVLWMPALMIVIGPIAFPLLMFPAGASVGAMTLAEHAGRKKLAMFFQCFAFAYLAALLSFHLYMVYQLAAMYLGGKTLLAASAWVVGISGLAWGGFVTQDRDNTMFTGLIFFQVAAGALAMALTVMLSLSAREFFALSFFFICAFMIVQYALEKRSARG